MVPEIALNALAFLDRPTLEGLQIVSRLLRDLVDGNAHSLPLRFLSYMELTGDVVDIQCNDGRLEHFPEARHHPAFPHHLSNAYIRLLKFDFRPEYSGVLQFLLTNANALRCRIGGMCIRDADVEIDYALLDTLADTFRPTLCRVALGENLDEDYATLFTDRAFRGRADEVEFELYDIATPACIVPGLFGLDAPRTCAIETFDDPVPWITNFIQTLRRTERGTRVPQTLTLIHARFEEPNAMPRTTEPLNGVSFVYAPAPHSDFVKRWLKTSIHEGSIPKESRGAKLYAFEEVMPGTSLDVFMWTIRQGRCLAFINKPSLHYAFLLKFRPS